MDGSIEFGMVHSNIKNNRGDPLNLECVCVFVLF